MNQVCEKQDETDYLQVLTEFNPLYSTVRVEELETCHRAVHEGGELSTAIEGKSAQWVLMAYRVSREADTVADRFLSLSPKEQLLFSFEGLSDYTLATLHDILLISEPNEETKRLSQRMDEALVAILGSPTASPLLDYGWMYMDAVQYHVPDRRGMDPVKMLRESLAYDIAMNNGKQIVNILFHMASVYVECDELDKAVDIHTALIKHDPRRFQSFYEFAFDVAKARQFEVAVKIGSRGLGVAVIESSSRDKELASDLAEHMRWWTSDGKSHDDESLGEDLRKRIEAALEASPLDAPTLDQVVHELIPNIEEIPVKKAWSEQE